MSCNQKVDWEVVSERKQRNSGRESFQFDTLRIDGFL